MRARELKKPSKIDEGITDTFNQGWKSVRDSAPSEYFKRAGTFGSSSQAAARAKKYSNIVSNVNTSQFVTNLQTRLDNGINDGYISDDKVADAVKKLLEPRISKFVNREENQANIDKFANAIQQNYLSKTDPSATIQKLYNYLVYWAQQSITSDQIAQASRRTSEPVHDTDKAKEITELVKKIDLNPSKLETTVGKAFVEAANKLMDELGIRHT